MEKNVISIGVLLYAVIMYSHQTLSPENLSRSGVNLRTSKNIPRELLLS